MSYGTRMEIVPFTYLKERMSENIYSNKLSLVPNRL